MIDGPLPGGLAEYLDDVFLGSIVEKLDIGLVEDVPRKRGRPKKHQSNRERVATSEGERAETYSSAEYRLA